MDGTLLDKDAYYKVVVNDFMASGGDGYDFSNAKNMYDTNIVMREPFVKGLFTNTPRMLLSSLIAYAVSEAIDVWLYHAWWNLTEKKTGSHTKMLWFRNNFSTLISQFINIVIFNFGAFLGIYSFKELLAITGACYVIYVATSLLDTPFVYLARKLAKVEE